MCLAGYAALVKSDMCQRHVPLPDGAALVGLASKAKAKKVAHATPGHHHSGNERAEA